MDETHADNDVTAGKIVLKNVGEEARIARNTGKLSNEYGVNFSLP